MDDSSITGGEILETVIQFLGKRGPGVDEVYSEFLKALDVVGLFWLTQLYNFVWRSWVVHLDWQTRVVVPIFKKGGQRVYYNYRGITLLSLSVKIYASVLERRVRQLIESQFKEEQCSLRRGRRTLDQFFNLSRILKGAWEFVHAPSRAADVVQIQRK